MHAIPKLPVLDGATFSGNKEAVTPSLLKHPAITFTQSGRASILLALEMLKIGSGDRVLVPVYHCPTMVAPIVALGAEPVFYPITDTGAPDMPWLRSQPMANVRAILVAHFFGLPQPMVDMRAWCDQDRVVLIEDCAHALFGSSGTRPVGNWGDLAIASLTKFLPVPEGGCLVDNLVPAPLPPLQTPSLNSQLKAGYDIVQTSVEYGRLFVLSPLIYLVKALRNLIKRRGLVTPPTPTPPADDAASADSFSIDVARSHTALTQPCIWIARHAHLQRIVERRRANYQFFGQVLADVSGMHPLLPQLPAHCAPYVFPLWVDQPDPGYAELRRLQYPVSRWDWLWPTVPDIAGDHGKQWSHHVLQLACHQDLTAAELHNMVATIKQVYA